MHRSSASSRICVFVLSVALSVVAACKKEAREAAGYFNPSSPRVEAAAAGTAAQAKETAAGTLAASLKLIRTGQIAVEVPNYEEAAKKVADLARVNGGYVAETRVTRAGADKQRGTLTVRVRADLFEAAFRSLKALGKVESEGMTTQDITKAYTDLETRLRVKRDAETRMREILRTKTAKLSDIVEVEKELTRLVEEIEQMEGERRYYDQQVALSTITAELYEREAIVRPSSLSPIREAFRDSLAALSSSIAALMTVIVYAAPWLILLILLWKWRGRSRARRLAKRPNS
jgi:hypothetical protein